jgi:hypothetical protein
VPIRWLLRTKRDEGIDGNAVGLRDIRPCSPRIKTHDKDASAIDVYSAGAGNQGIADSDNINKPLISAIGRRPCTTEIGASVESSARIYCGEEKNGLIVGEDFPHICQLRLCKALRRQARPRISVVGTCVDTVLKV